MKILIVHNFYRGSSIGGEDVVVQNELTALKDELGEENVYTYFVSNDTMRFKEVLCNIFFSRKHLHAISAIIEQHKIDIVHVHNFFPILSASIFHVAKTNHVKIIQTLHNFRPWCISGILFREGKKCTKCIDRRSIWYSAFHGCYRDSRIFSFIAAIAFYVYQKMNYQAYIDKYIVLSKTQKQQLCAIGIEKSKLAYKPNFIKPSGFSQLPSDQKEGFLYVGRLDIGKGIKLLVQAFKQLKSKTTLTIIGEGPLKGWLINEAKALSVKILGSVPNNEALAYMQRAKYLIHPGLMLETFGMTILEAMSCSTPVIGLKLGTRVELIEDELNGFLCEPHELGITLEKALSFQRYSLLCENARSFANQFLSSTIVKEQINIYSSLLRKNNE